MPRLSDIRGEGSRGRGELARGVERRLDREVLTICPVCGVSGPTTRLEEHLAKDHGMVEEYIGAD